MIVMSVLMWEWAIVMVAIVIDNNGGDSGGEGNGDSDVGGNVGAINCDDGDDDDGGGGGDSVSCGSDDNGRGNGGAGDGGSFREDDSDGDVTHSSGVNGRDGGEAVTGHSSQNFFQGAKV